jgi:hypothetical protein
MINICELYACEYEVKFNSSKSVLVTHNVHGDVNLTLNGSPISHVNSAMHLGHYVGEGYNRRNVPTGICNLICRMNIMMSRFGFCTSEVKSSLFRTYCANYYGSPIWNL